MYLQQLPLEGPDPRLAQKTVWKSLNPSSARLLSSRSCVISWPWDISLRCVRACGWGPMTGLPSKLPSILTPDPEPSWPDPDIFPSHHTDISARRSATRSRSDMCKVTFSEMAPPGWTLILIREVWRTSTSSAWEETGFPSIASLRNWNAYFLRNVSRWDFNNNKALWHVA